MSSGKPTCKTARKLRGDEYRLCVYHLSRAIELSSYIDAAGWSKRAGAATVAQPRLRFHIDVVRQMLETTLHE